MSRKRGLGSGLDALLHNDDSGKVVRELAVDTIDPNPRQPRQHFDDATLDELAASIREHGILQPLLVSTHASGNRYVLIAGERRWRAAMRAGLTTVPAVIREATPQQLVELAYIENVQRADLNVIEEAAALQALKDEFGLSDELIAIRLGLQSRVAVTNTRRLLRLPAAAQQAIVAGHISAGHGRALLRIDDDALQSQALNVILTESCNVRQTERLCEAVQHTRDLGQARAEVWPPAVQPTKKPAPRAAAAEAPAISDDDQLIGRELEYRIGTPVSLVRHANTIRVTLTFYTDESLQAFLEQLGTV